MTATCKTCGGPLSTMAPLHDRAVMDLEQAKAAYTDFIARNGWSPRMLDAVGSAARIERMAFDFRRRELGMCYDSTSVGGDAVCVKVVRQTRADRLAAALQGLLDSYVRLAESGDAEKEDAVIAARAALSEKP